MTLMTPPPLDQQQQQEDDEMLVPHTDFPPHGPQPMEVAQAETASTVDAQPVDDPPSARFTWTIDNFSRLNIKKLYSDVFYVGGYKWRILIFPKGNNVDHLSMYLDVADSGSLPYGWSRYAQFSLSVVNQLHSKYSVRKETQHQFNARESDWGFTSFMPLGELYDPARGYLVNDTCIVEADVAVRRVVDYWSHDSKKETGYVGLKNQGATCYMNSLLQTLYHIPYFRKAVYHMPTTENDNPSGSIPLALQSLFYKLQYSDTSVATKELTKSFGWDTHDSFLQHDVQELNRVLCEKLEDKMKGTVVEGTIQQLFEGHHMNYIECINVDYKSTRKESFYDLQLDVKGCRDVYASFDKYVEVERLEGDNKYHAEQYGLQDARKGVLFIDFPPVLQLQLKRFEYDFIRDTMVKINDRYEFPLQLDLDREDGKYLSPDADRSIRNLYTLHSVLVHSGGVHGGHYYAYIRPTLSDQWFKFDDERVTKEDMKRALEEQYGGEEELPQTNPGFNNAPFKFTKYSNAYMLVYIRESDKEKIICNVDEKDIAEHLRIRLKKEQEEKELKRKEKAEAHLYTIIKVARNEDLLEQIGKDIYFDLVDHDKVRSFRIQKQMPFNVFKEEVAKEFGVPVQFQRFWLWAKRQNHTYRPNRPLTVMEEAQSVGQLREVSNKANNAELKLFLEVELGPDTKPIAPPEKTKEKILLFFKLYDPSKEEMRYIGRLFVKGAGKPSEILNKLNEMAGFSPDEEIDLFEEIKFEPAVMCEHIDKKATFRASQLEDGDIICFQKSNVGSEQCRYPDVPSFLEYVRNRQMMREEKQEEEEANKDEKADLNTTNISEKEQKKSEFTDLQPGQAQEEPTNPKIATPDSQGTELPQIPENTKPEHSNPLPGKRYLQAILAGQPSVQPQEKCFASFSEFNTFFDDIQSLLEVQTSKVQKYPKRFCAEQIGEAEKILKQCLDMDLTCIIQSGKALELKNSLSVVLSTNAFPDNVVSETAKFIGNFNRNCEDYEAAQQDLGEAQENENAVAELKTNLEQLVSKFMHVKSEAESIDGEIDWLERQINDRKAKKARLMKRAGDLAGQATTSKQVLIQAEQTRKLSLIKKEQAVKTVKDFERSWESLKELHIRSQAGKLAP